jgi:tetratricopeptide (TPR) repeat protein
MRSLLLVCLLLSSRAFGAGSDPVPAPTGAAPAVKTADAAYNAGLAAKAAEKWPEAETSFREATELKPDFPEAWNELGHARKKRGLYDDSVKAYQEALRLRPDFPQAMQYLGETYVRMGKRPEAQAMLDRLRPLDAKLASQLEAAMKGEASGY